MTATRFGGARALEGSIALGGALGCNLVTGADDLHLGGGSRDGSGGSSATYNNPSGGTGGVPGATTAGTGALAPTSTSTTSTTTSSAVTTTTSGATTSTTSASSGGGPNAAQDCVDGINAFRATLGLPAYQRWNSASRAPTARPRPTR